jgi:hypothetical protein
MFPLTDLSILFTALLIIALVFLGGFILFGLLIYKRVCKTNLTPPQLPTVPPLPPDIEITLAMLNQKIETYHVADIKRANKDRFERISYIAWGFTLSTGSLAIALLNRVAAWETVLVLIISICFFVIGWIANDRMKKYQ